MELSFTGTKSKADHKGHSFEFGSLPVQLRQRTVMQDDTHEELLHWHDDIEILRIKDGNLHCHVNDSDHVLDPGELCFINFDTLHRVYNTEEDAAVLDVLTVSTDMLTSNKEIYDKYVAPIIHNPDFAHVQIDGSNSYARLISDIFDALYELAEEQSTGYELDVIGYIYMIFRRLYMVYIAQDDMPVSYTSDVSLQRRMSTFIYEHYQEKITLDDIAGAAGVSRSKCANLFRKYSQKTPVNFLNSYRLEMAGKMLLSTDESVAYIANECGISEQSYFNRMFMKEFGCTPLEWRKKNRRKGDLQ